MLFDRNQKNQNDYDASIRYAAEEAKIEMAKELLKIGMSPEQISEITKLSPKEFTKN